MKLYSNWDKILIKDKETLLMFGKRVREKAILEKLMEPSWNLILTPLSIATTDLKLLETDLGELLELWLNILNRIKHFDNNNWLATLGYNRCTIDLLLNFTKTVESDVFCRWDLIFTNAGPKILELNIGSNTGGITFDKFGCFYKNNSVVKPEQMNLTCKNEKPFDSIKYWASGILKKLENLPMNKAVCIIEDDECFESYKSTLNLLAQEVQSITEHPVCVAKSSQLIEKDGQLFFNQMEIGAIYSFFTVEDILTKTNQYTNIINSINKGTIIQIMGFEYVSYGNKLIMDFIFNNRKTNILTTKEKRLVEKYFLPCKRLTLETLDYAIENQDNLICKPADNYGGIGVVCGSDMTVQQWKKHLLLIIKQQQPFLIQQRAIGKKINLIFSDTENRITYGERIPVIGLFMMEKKIIGGISRAKNNDDGVVNIQNGGAVGTILKFDKN